VPRCNPRGNGSESRAIVPHVDPHGHARARSQAVRVHGRPGRLPARHLARGVAAPDRRRADHGLRDLAADLRRVRVAAELQPNGSTGARQLADNALVTERARPLPKSERLNDTCMFDGCREPVIGHATLMVARSLCGENSQTVTDDGPHLRRASPGVRPDRPGDHVRGWPPRGSRRHALGQMEHKYEVRSLGRPGNHIDEGRSAAPSSRCRSEHEPVGSPGTRPAGPESSEGEDRYLHAVVLTQAGTRLHHRQDVANDSAESYPGSGPQKPHAAKRFMGSTLERDRQQAS